MSDISLLMAGVLVTAPISALNLPQQPINTSENSVQQSTQEKLSHLLKLHHLNSCNQV
ncbi:hypothetical protein [Nostoc sp.]|uniref:hypothetical protein n=1 Tax=Nostoc sp. TaxID=1180 RepID=UPI002FFC063D